MLRNVESKRQAEIDEFVQHMDWLRVVDIWSSRLEELGVSIRDAFATIVLHDSVMPTGRENGLVWWEVAQIQSEHLSAQEHHDRHPGTLGLTHADAHLGRKGVLQTLEYLYDVRENEEAMAAVLISASLFSRMHSSRSRYPHDYWPPFYCVQVLDRWANEKWSEHSRSIGWHFACTEVLPECSWDCDYHLDALGALVRYLAEEHALLLRRYKPIVVEFNAESDPFIRKILDEKYRKQDAERAAWKKKTQAIKQQKNTDDAALKLKHPLHNQWHSIKKDELQKLVWSKPTSELAADFGVSDVAIGRRCKREGILKPPPGFWARVQAGKIPHPAGIPVDLD